MAAELKLIVMFPPPTDGEQFEKDYRAHLGLVQKHMRSASAVSAIRIQPALTASPPYHLMLFITYDSPKDLQTDMASADPVMADAHRISTGGLPVIMLGT